MMHGAASVLSGRPEDRTFPFSPVLGLLVQCSGEITLANQANPSTLGYTQRNQKAQIPRMGLNLGG